MRCLKVERDVAHLVTDQQQAALDAARLVFEVSLAWRVGE
jgi:hypothetical protein